jgi:PilZ domain
MGFWTLPFARKRVEGALDMSTETRQPPTLNREFGRWTAYRGLNVVYEGSSQLIEVHPPDLSAHGMFINTPQHFPEGAVLKLEFRLGRSGQDIHARAEVRYCLPGIGVGVEFIETAEADERTIAEEIASRMGDSEA